jgi:UDP-glucuronate 4-epimerase
MTDGGWDVTVVDNFNDFYDPAIKRANIAAHLDRRNFELFAGDIVDTNAMNELCAAKRFDTVVHLAARAGVRPSLAQPILYETTNVRGTYSLLEAARNNGVERFIFGSSSSVYGVGAQIPFSEDQPLASPISPYAATKIAGEAACHVYSHLFGIRILCLRFFTVYGARQRPDLAIHKFARMISAGHPIPIYGDGATRRDYTFIDDIISGVVAALHYEASQYEVINLGEAQTIEMNRLVELLEGALGKKAIIDREAAQPGDLPVTCANIDKARRLLGYEPLTQIEAGIDRFARWFESKG